MAATTPTLPTAVDYSVAASTSTVNVTSGDATSLQTALTNAAFGQQIVLPVATYTGQFTLPVPSGSSVGGGTVVTARPVVSARPAISARPAFTARPAVNSIGDKWVTIISANSASLPAAGTRVALADASNMPTLVASNSATTNQVISASANTIHHYRFVGIKFSTPQIASYATCVRIAPFGSQATEANYPHHVSFERCIMQPDPDYGCRKGFEVNATNVQWVDCYITDVKQAGQGDANAIYGAYGRGPYKVHNCRVEGMGENIFFGGASDGGIPVTAGYEYYTPADITITNNYIRRKLSWKTDHATYVPCCETAGSGTISSANATTVTFSGSQTLSGKYIKGVTSGAVAKVTSNGTTCNITYFVGSDFTDGESYRYNSGDLTCKNLLEFKAGQRVSIQNNVFENGFSLGQSIGGLTLTPREYGYLADYTIKYNKFIDCTGLSISYADPSGGSGVGPSPYAFHRMLLQHNLFHNQNSTEATSLLAWGQGMTLSMNQLPYGGLSYHLGGSIAAGATTGNGVTFTQTGQSTNAFTSAMVGLVIAYGSGRATITAMSGSPDASSYYPAVTANITVAFADTSAHQTIDWFVGPSATVATRYAACDSWVIDHNTMAGSCTYDFAVRFQDHQGVGTGTDPVVASTNFVFRNNLMFIGDDPSTGHGLSAVLNGGGTSGIDNFLTSYFTSPIYAKNVLFGPQTLRGATASNGYNSGYTVGPGPSALYDTMFHDPDQAGGNDGSGAVGFTDHAGGDYTITGTYATAATDGTMIGCDIAALNTAISGVAS